MSDEIRDHLLAQKAAHREFAEQVFAAAEAGTSYVEDMDDPDAAEFGQDPYDALAERPLAIETTKRITILMGTGGPHTELVADLDRDNLVESVHWNGYWGGDRIEHSISRTDPLWRLAEHYIEYAVAD